jgi:hypothetical protein
LIILGIKNILSKNTSVKIMDKGWTITVRFSKRAGTFLSLRYLVLSGSESHPASSDGDFFLVVEVAGACS